MDQPPPPVVTQEVRVVDAAGRPRILLSAKDGTPTIVLLREDGTASVSVATDDKGRPAVSLVNPDPGGPGAKLEIDDKGAHVKFDRSGGGTAYLFLNDAGGSGVVLIDTAGKRRLSGTVGADGRSTVERLDAQGSPVP